MSAFQLRNGSAFSAIAINYLAVGWSAVVGMLLLPVYVGALGVEKWGIVALNVTVGGVLSLLDAGLSQIMPRDIAQADIGGDRGKVYAAYARLYLVLAGGGALIAMIAMPWILTDWLSVPAADQRDVTWVLRCGVIQFGFQFANAANLGFWFGSEKHGVANMRTGFFLAAKHVSALACVFFVSKTVLCYVLPMAIVAGVEYIANRIAIGKVLHSFGRHETDSAPMGAMDIARRARTVAAAVVIGMLVTQTDRLVLSRQLSISDFGVYGVIASLGLAIFQLQQPIVRTFTPKFAIAVNQRVNLSRLRWEFVTFVGVIFLVPVAMLAAFAEPLLRLWVPSVASRATAFALRLFCLAGALNCIYQYFYLQLIALHQGRRILVINLVGVVAIVTYWTFVPVRTLGIVSGAWMWVVLTLCQIGVAGILTAMERKNVR